MDPDKPLLGSQISNDYIRLLAVIILMVLLIGMVICCCFTFILFTDPKLKPFKVKILERNKANNNDNNKTSTDLNVSSPSQSVKFSLKQSNMFKKSNVILEHSQNGNDFELETLKTADIDHQDNGVVAITSSDDEQ